jgi:excisionase family DNA binding protein
MSDSRTQSPAPNRRARRRPESQPGGRRWASMQDAAEYLQVTDRTIRQMVADGRITGYRNGRRLVRIDLNELDAAMRPFGGAA